MKLTNEEKQLLETTRKLESRKCREMLMSHAEAMHQAQEALKEDYGLMVNGTEAMSALQAS